MADSPLFFDLGAIAAHLSGIPKYRPLIELIRRYGDAMSVLNDLRECSECLDALSAHNPLKALPPAGQHSHQVVSSALMSRAIILYVRATKTSSQHRRFVPLHKNMPGELASVHKRMAELRDNAIAHFGPGPGGSRPRWVRETAALRLDGEKASLVLLYSRTGIQTDLPDDLRRLVDHVTERAWHIAGERADELLAEGKRWIDADPEFTAIVRSNFLDLSAFFEGDNAAVRQAIAGDSTAQDLPRPSYWRTEFARS